MSAERDPRKASLPSTALEKKAHDELAGLTAPETENLRHAAMRAFVEDPHEPLGLRLKLAYGLLDPKEKRDPGVAKHVIAAVQLGRASEDDEVRSLANATAGRLFDMLVEKGPAASARVSSGIVTAAAEGLAVQAVDIEERYRRAEYLLGTAGHRIREMRLRHSDQTDRLEALVDASVTNLAATMEAQIHEFPHLPMARLSENLVMRIMQYRMRYDIGL